MRSRPVAGPQTEVMKERRRRGTRSSRDREGTAAGTGAAPRRRFWDNTGSLRNVGVGRVEGERGSRSTFAASTPPQQQRVSDQRASDTEEKPNRLSRGRESSSAGKGKGWKLELEGEGPKEWMGLGSACGRGNGVGTVGDRLTLLE